MSQTGRGLAAFALIFGLIGTGIGGFYLVNDYLLVEEPIEEEPYVVPRARVYRLGSYSLDSSDTVIFDYTNKSYDTFISELITDYDGHWRTDENFMYDKLLNYPNLTVLRDRDFSKRVDRRKWKYDDDKVKNGYYIDSHSIRPFKTNKDQIDRLINIILND